MFGLALAGGLPLARNRVEKMLAEFRREQAVVLEPWDGMAAGIAMRRDRFAVEVIDGGPSQLSILFAGEIFAERETIANPGRRVLDLFEAREHESLARLNGTFSALVIEPRSRTLHLVTDRFGHRPFFVWSAGERYAAATRLPALLADERVPRRLSRQGIVELMSFQRTFGEHTQYADIRSMPAASLWMLSGDGLKTRRLRKLAWQPQAFSSRDGPTILAEAFQSAVRRRVAGRGRAALLLSGGLDARAILGAADRAGLKLPCATASAADNLETRIARDSAKLAGVPFHLIANSPSRLAARLDEATRACDGLFSAPVNMFGMWPELRGAYDALLSGHAFDYTFRGYYLPCSFIQIGRSPTRLPRLLKIPDGRPETVARMQRIGTPPDLAGSVMVDELARSVERRRSEAVAHALEGCTPRSPYDAWDGFIMHTLGRHYAYSDFVAMETEFIHRAPAYDHDVFDIYLSMPPEWRASGRIVREAMRIVAPELMRLPDANTGVRASLPFAAQIGLGYAKAAARRLRLMKAPTVPEPGITQGSWSDYDTLFRSDPGFMARLDALARSEHLAATGLFDMTRLTEKVQAQRGGKIKFKRVLWQLLTLDSWLRQFGYSGVAND